MVNWEKFMLESNRIEKEDRINPGDEAAFNYALCQVDDIEDILNIHKLLGEYLNRSWVGKYRDVVVYIGSHALPHPDRVPGLMDKFIKRLPKLDSWHAHNEFEHIHPFQDLNGRTGRLIWLSKAVREGYNFKIPFLQMYYYQTLENC